MPTGENKSLQLGYKAECYGRELIKIDRWFPSSKRCSSCGHIVEKMPPALSGVEGLNIREWDCPQCGTHHDRDLNASLNILAAKLGRVSLRSDQKSRTE